MPDTFVQAEVMVDEGKAVPNKPRMFLRKLVIMLFGVFLSAQGVSLSIQSGLGASPTGVCPAIFSPMLGISNGAGTAIQFMLFLLVQVALLRKDFRPLQILQLAIAVFFGLMVDATAQILAPISVVFWWQKVIFSAGGILSLAFGIFLVLKINLLMLPPDAMIQTIADKCRTEYARIKVIVDGSLTAIALAGSLLVYKKLVHVGIGTIAAAFLIGLTIGRLYRLPGLNLFLDKAVGAETKG